MIPANPNSETRISSNVYNFIVSEGLRGTLFSKVPDDVRLCFVLGDIAEIDNIIFNDACRIKLRGRVMASLYKFPGLP